MTTDKVQKNGFTYYDAPSSETFGLSLLWFAYTPAPSADTFCHLRKVKLVFRFLSTALQQVVTSSNRTVIPLNAHYNYCSIEAIFLRNQVIPNEE
jgi:hypothetical protein